MDNQEIETFNNLQGVPLSQLKKISSTILGKLDTPDLEISNVFYRITPTEAVPFVSWNNIYKVFRGFTPPSVEWLNLSPDFIVLKYSKSNDEEIYEDARIELSPTKSSILYFQYDFESKNQYNPTTIFENLGSAIGYSIVDGKYSEKDVVSTFDVPTQEVENYILKDLITNDQSFRKYLTIDESYQTKKSYLTIRYYAKKVSFTFTVTQQSDNGAYLRIKIKGGHNKSEIEGFMSVLSKLLTIYNQEEKGISEIYKSYGINIEKRAIEVAKPDKQPSGFSRRCPKNKTASMNSTEEEALALVDDQANRVMTLPVNEVDKYYTCSSTSEFIYPGLTSSQNDDDGVPCCFKKPQVNVPDSRYEKFMSGDSTSKSKRTPHILSGNKSLGPDQQASIPDKLKLLFNGKLPSPKYSFMRYGVKQSPRSVISCISRTQIVVEDEYAEKPILAKQEMYNYSTNEIKSILLDESAYVDPRLFTTLLGEIDKLNIFMFDRNGIIKPCYENGYYKRDNDFKSIIIYEQPIDKRGSESQWELIALVTGRDKQFVFEHDSEISVWLRDMLYKKTLTKVNGKNLPRVSGLPVGLVCKGQMLDASGKTRIVEVISPKNQTFMFQTSPIQPLDCPDVRVSDIKPYTQAEETAFVELIGVGASERSGGFLRFDLSNGVSISIPVISNEEQNSTESRMRAYIKNKRLSRYMTEYVKWMFAKYGDPLDIDKFITDKVEVDIDYVYNGVTKNFNEDDNGIISNGKIMVDSEKTREQVKFIIEMIVLRTPSLLAKYKDMVQIPDYHLEITDFKKNLAVSASDNRDLQDYNFNVFKGVNILNYMTKQN
jgi:hypothetical protein